MAKKGNGIFLVYTDIDPVHDEEFNAWYDTEHLPDLLRLPGFLDAARYVAVKGGPKYLAAYELESADALFMTHDNVGVGRMIAEAVTEAQPTGNFAIIKGQEGQTNPLFLREGFEEVIAPLIAAGDVTIPEGAEVYTDEWLPDNAQDNMETILTATDNDIQAVLVQNDGMAGGVIAALAAQGLDGEVAVGGQDGDKAAINRVALGTQVVSVLKDATELGRAAGEAALQLCENPDISAVEGAVPSTTVGGIEGFAVLLDPLPITRDNLQDALDLNWLTEEEMCADVPAGSVGGCP